MANLTILSKDIRTLNGLYSLNDLHKASGSASKHQPSFFLRNVQTKELIEEINRSANSQIACETFRGGCKQGTWVCKELVYFYAMWISAKFHLQVIRAFDALTQRRSSVEDLDQNLSLLHNAKTACRKMQEKEESSYQELIVMDSSLQQLARTIEATQLQVKSLLSGYHTKRDHLAHLYLSHRLMKV
ncbi:KilA-N domain-containing protein [Vibrio fluvialis]|uniref:KilA-N domain-containing protein n=1 Tax=Vibrio fluvialis TaxID=676 RepID=UPI003D7C36BF